MSTNNISPIGWYPNQFGRTASDRDNPRPKKWSKDVIDDMGYETPKIGASIVSDDIASQSQMPSIPPICSICEIPEFDGFDHHGPVIGHFEAIKAYLKVCQDQIEKDRIEGLGRDDDQVEDLKRRLQLIDDVSTNSIALLGGDLDLAQVKSVLSSYLQVILANARLRPLVVQYPIAPIVLVLEPGENIERIMAHLSSRHRRHNDAEESARTAEEREAWGAFDSNTGIVRDILPSNVSDETQGMVSDEERKNYNADNLGA